ncbi:hypothetical protein L950_0216250 [Sphingobacterium sp. IITKGP-BTPF85]|jgi:hypothetical protein|nr:hypothetical protein L950_0216250 [Sphingobacterium sp. IITKGP-BTPF85]
MEEQDFELLETLDYNDIFSGNGGTTGVVFLMKKKIEKRK